MQNCQLSLIVLVTVCNIVFGNNDLEYFSSITGLESLLETEQNLLQDAKQYIQATKTHMATLESELLSIAKEHEAAKCDTENYLANPVNVYRLMKRLYTDWHTYEDRIRHDFSGTRFLERMVINRKNLNFPSRDDIDGSAMALVRLQETYQLDVAQIAAGILNGVKYGYAMTWQDCLILGQQLFEMQNYKHTKTWLKESMNRLSNEKYSNDSSALDIRQGVAESLLHLGDLDSALKFSNEVLELDPGRTIATDIREKAEALLINGYLVDTKLKSSMHPYHHTNEFKTYEKVCRGEYSPTSAQLRPLRCRYASNNSPFHRIAPFKLEEHSLDPLILTVHDIIAHSKISTLREMATPRMKRSTVTASKTSNLGASAGYRISKNAWLEFHTHRYMQDMLRDIHDATGLDMSHCEQLQVANYGLGGQYEPHFDFYKQVPDEYGNRIATAMFYLSDVEQGGATAFPHLHLAVKPQKGNALFWYNLHRSLDKDYRTVHAGCPVLKGSKWIANVWIRESSQVFARPCALRRDNEASLMYKFVM